MVTPPQFELVGTSVRRSVRYYTLGVLVVAQLIVSGAFSEAVLNVPYVEQSSYYVLLALGVVSAVLGWSSLPLTFRSKSFVLFIGICIVSVLWSVSPLETIRLSMALVAVVCVCTLAIWVLSLRDLAVSLAVAGAVSAIMAVALWFAGFSEVIDPAFQTLRGTFVQKNVFGRALAVGAIGGIVAILLSGASRQRKVSVSCLIAVAVGLVAAGSNTALVSTIASGVVIAWVRMESRLNVQSILAWRFAAIGCTVLAFCIVPPQVMLAAGSDGIGRDLTLTGRTSIWAAVVDAVSQRPFLGFGYGAFWSDSTLAELVSRTVNFDVPHAHNGVLDLGLGVGALGVAALVVALLPVAGVVVGVPYKDKAKTGSRTFAAGFFPLVVFINVTESQLLSQFGGLMIPIVLLVLIATQKSEPYEPDERGAV